MNKFFDISENETLPDNDLKLRNLGKQRSLATIGKATRGYDGRREYISTDFYTDVVPEDYDNHFAHKLKTWTPIYELDKVLEFHYSYYTSKSPGAGDEFVKHIRYVILPKLKKQHQMDVCVELVEGWLSQKTKNPLDESSGKTINQNTITIGSLNAPSQFQLGSNHSNQVQHNGLSMDAVEQAFYQIKKDIKNVDERIRGDFSMEMDYAIGQLERHRDAKPQLLNIGSLIRQVGLGTFTNLLAAPIFEVVKPFLGFH